MAFCICVIFDSLHKGLRNRREVLISIPACAQGPMISCWGEGLSHFLNEEGARRKELKGRRGLQKDTSGKHSATFVSPSAWILEDVFSKVQCQAGIAKSVPRLHVPRQSYVGEQKWLRYVVLGAKGVTGNNWLHLSPLRLKHTALAFQTPQQEPLYRHL